MLLCSKHPFFGISLKFAGIALLHLFRFLIKAKCLPYQVISAFYSVGNDVSHGINRQLVEHSNFAVKLVRISEEIIDVGLNIAVNTITYGRVCIIPVSIENFWNALI